jgi:hypothetical protein
MLIRFAHAGLTGLMACFQKGEIMDSNIIRLDPEPSILIESLRDIGYSFNSALADIVDNSITANAYNIRILAIPDPEFKIAIIDDGEGLKRDDLKQAMRLGSNDPRQKRALNDLGRFGLGLKTASFSQCRRLTVVSRRDGNVAAFTWDLDVVVAENAWSVIEHTNPEDIPFFSELGESGTMVLWEKLDRLTGERGSGKVDYTRLISEAQDYLSLVFHRYLSGERGISKISIQVNNLNLDPIDPFNAKHRATQSSPVEQICPGVTMQAFTLPHRSHYDSQQEYERYGLNGGYLKSQGIYLYRAKRLILYGTWFGLAKKTALTQLTRVKIDIDVNQDEIWKIDVKKVSAQMPEVVRARVKSLITTIGAPSKKTYRRRATRLTTPDVYPAWDVVQEGGKRVYRINRKHPVIASLADSLDSTDGKALDTVLSLIESSFPTESLFYDFANNEDKVVLPALQDEAFSDAAKTFFSSLKQTGQSDETILSLMHSAEPFQSRWQETLGALGIKEQ